MACSFARSGVWEFAHSMAVNPTTLQSHAVAIVAAGVVSPLGRGIGETACALRAGRDCVTEISAFDVAKTRCKTAGQVEDAWLDDVRATSKKTRRFHKASLMMMAAAREVRAMDAAFAPEQMIIGATGGGMTYGEAFYRSLSKGGSDRRRAAWLANYNPQKAVLDAQEDAGWRTPSIIIANACASGTNAMGHAFELIRRGTRRAILCGGYDAISEMFWSIRNQCVYLGYTCPECQKPMFDGLRDTLRKTGKCPRCHSFVMDDLSRRFVDGNWI